MLTNDHSYFSVKNIWKIAFPIILGSLAQDIITVVDTIFIGHLGEIELGGAAIGSIFYLTIVMIGWGFGLGVQIMVARRYGEKNYNAINKLVQHSFIILIILATTSLILIRNFDHFIFRTIISSDAIYSESLKFINIRVFGLLAAFININFRAFFIGTADTRIISYTTAAMAIINIVLDYLLIFGIGIFPEMGIKGAALASVIAEYSALIYFFVYTITRKTNLHFKLFKFHGFEWNLIPRIFKIATPTMIQNFISFSAWFFFFLMVEKMGETELAISNIVRSIYMIILLPIMGFASATNTLVSFSIGNGTERDVWPIIKRSIGLSFVGISIMVGFALLFPNQIIGSYTSINSIITATLPIFYVVLFASFALAFGLILLNAVSGTGNTHITMIIEILVIVIYLIWVYFASTSKQSNIAVVWCVEIFYGLGLGILSFVYLKNDNWHKKSI